MATIDERPDDPLGLSGLSTFWAVASGMFDLPASRSNPLKLGIVWRGGKVLNHRSLLKVLVNPVLVNFGWLLATECHESPVYMAERVGRVRFSRGTRDTTWRDHVRPYVLGPHDWLEPRRRIF